MKQRVFLAVALIFAMALATNAEAQQYDFSAVAPTGHTLYYRITNSGSHTVALTHPASGTVNYAWDGYTKPTGSLAIPSTVSYNSTSYTVDTIDDYAFYGCNSLTSVTIPNSVTSIGNYAFQYCSGLTSVTIPDSVTSIGGSAFSNCTGLTLVTIGGSVTSIGNYAFYHCSGLTSIAVESGNTHYDSRNSCNAIIETATNTLIRGCKNTIIPNSVTSIGNYAFSGCSGLTSLTIPNSVTSIGNNAFQYCSGLTSVIFNADSCISAGNSSFPAFYNCSNLTSFTFGNNVKRIPDYLCYGLSSLTSLTIPNSVTTIGERAFYNCSGLTSITIGGSVTSIGDYAFRECSSLTSVTIPNSMTSIGNSAFSFCSGLTSVIFNADSCISNWSNSSYTAFNNCSNLTSFTFGNNVKRIPDYLCYRLSRLTSLTIPNSVTSIGSYAFSRCSGLTSITSLANEPPTIGSTTFNNVSTTIPLFVPCGTEAAYRAANYWNSFQNIHCSGTTITACDSYTWHGNTYTTSGMYIDGNDTLYLTVNYNSSTAYTQTACDSYIWSNHDSVNTYTTSGTYYNSYATAEGCASVDTLYLTVYYNSNVRELMTACDSYTWNNHGSVNTYTTSGTYYNSYATAEGCPSVDTLYLTVNYNSNASETMTACDSYTWNNHGNSNVCTENGTYFSSYNTADGCPSVDTLYLTIAHHSGNSEVITACDRYTWRNHGNVISYTTSGAYYSSYNTAEGCPSVDTLYLTINHSSRYTDVYDVCDCMTWTAGDGNTYTASSSSHSVHRTNAAGCDSIVTLDLTVRHSTTATDVHDVCGSYTWINGETYTTNNNTDTAHRINSVGCDSLVTLNLTVRHNSNTAYTVTAYDSYMWATDGRVYNYNATGVYYNGYTADNGCPSVDTLYLTIVQCAGTVVMHDTVTLIQHVPIHDTTYIDTYIHDTIFNNRYIHDTTFVNNYVHDTLWLTRTVWDYIYDTLYLNIYIHDTTFVNNYIHDTIYLYRYLHDTIYIHDTVYMSGEGIEGANVINAKVYTSGGQVVVEGADGNLVTFYDINGRMLATKRDKYSSLRFDVPASGTYLIKIGNHPARKVVVVL